MNHLGALIAGKKKRSSELWRKTYYRNSFYYGLPFSIFLVFLTIRSDYADPGPCYATIILVIVAWVVVFYVTWQKVYR